MKLNKLILGITSALICFCSCNKEELKSEPVNGEKVFMTFGVGTSNAEITRAAADITGRTPFIYWQMGDQIKVFSSDGRDGATFDLKEIINNYENSGVFEGTCNKSSKYYLIYPAEAAERFNEDNYLIATIPPEQEAHVGTFDPKAMIQTGATVGATKQDVALKNTCAFLYITLPEGCKEVVVEPAYNENWYIAGTVRIETASGESKIPSTDGFVAGEHRVTLTKINGVAGTYVICIAPSTGCPGLKTTVTYTGGGSVTNITPPLDDDENKLQFNANFFYNLGTVPAKSN